MLFFFLIRQLEEMWSLPLTLKIRKYKCILRCDNNYRIIATLLLQFSAGSPQEAKEWVNQINFVLKGKPACFCTHSLAPTACVIFQKGNPSFVATQVLSISLSLLESSL